MLKNFFTVLGVCLMSIFMADMAFALPEDGGLGLQPAASPSMERIAEFHNLLLYIIFGIAIFVLILLVYVVLRFNKRVNPNPSKVTHNVMLEIAWTVIPVVILIIIAIPSFKLLYYVDRTENPDMTIKVTGYQWYWGYEYPDHGDISFSSYMIQDENIDTSKGQLRLLSTDNPVVVPVKKNIQVILTAGDVLHSWAVPALGVKQDTVPGRLNETWFRVNEPGTYYGQCSELCGKDHAYMPIEIKAVSEEEFAAWVEEQGGSMPSVEQEEAMVIDPVQIKATQQQFANLNVTSEGEE